MGRIHPSVRMAGRRGVHVDHDHHAYHKHHHAYHKHHPTSATHNHSHCHHCYRCHLPRRHHCRSETAIDADADADTDTGAYIQPYCLKRSW